MTLAQIIEYAKRGLFTLLGLFLALYLFVILVTYTPNDPSWSHISSDMTTINNMGGSAGAWLADLLYMFFGWSVWWLLVFLVYESILQWWEKRTPFGLWRVIAYGFLLLAGSALVTSLAMWLGISDASEVMLGNSSTISGGIVGFELSKRLIFLLTLQGSLLFLLFFMLVTITFAFNIRWVTLLRNFVQLSWLGSGIKADKKLRNRNVNNKRSNNEDCDNGFDEDCDDTHDDGKVSDKADREGDGADDLLENALLADDNHAYGQLPLRMRPAKFQQSKQVGRYDGQHHTGANANLQKNQSDNNDNEGLLSEFLLQSGLGESIQQQIQAEQAQLQQTESSLDGSSEPKPAAGVSDSVKHDVSQLADDWLESSDHQVLAAQWQADQPQLHDLPNHKIPSKSHQSASVVNMTPTNTPPANPKEPPTIATIEDEGDNIDIDKSPSEPVIPSIRFAVPEGDASNHIEDMVPDISDDAAFIGRSRAMQTAKYRQSLTPIPELDILDRPDPNRKPSYTQMELSQLSELLEIKLQEFNVKAEVVNAIPGPVVTRFEVELAAGVKASKVTGISRDLARSLSMASLRVVEVIPGKPYIGIEVPNKKREMVRLIELLNTEKYKDPKAQVSMAMGKDIGGKPIITDLAKAPHMLVAGTTGSGKSVLVNAMLLSMLLKYQPDELRLILIDPKQLELANYNDIPHLLTPVVTDMNEAASSLSWCVAEMERRYQLMSLLKVRKLEEFNKKVLAAQKAGRPMIDPLWRPNDSVSMDKAPKLKTLPLIVIVADEFADMIMQVGKQAEELITRLAQKSRAAGIHLMLATQRPSVDVITGLIKANIPVRAALRVNSKVDSRTILDSGGAEDMLGNGDMLFLGPGQIEPDRVHGAYVSDAEVNRVCDAWRERGAPDYIDNMASNFELTSPSSSSGVASGEDDDLYDEAVAFIMETRKVSASSIQRKFSIGYNRAARLVDSMEEAGIVSPMGKGGKREILR